MAATKLVSGVQREVWQDALAQNGGVAQPVPTGIRMSAQQLCRVHGLLVVGTPTGTPTFTATPSVVNGLLVVTVTNTAGGGAANAAPWMLDVQLEHSLVQATQGANGYILIASGTAAAGLGTTETLAQAYAVGALAADQTLVLATAKGNGVIIDGVTQAGTAGLYALEVREGYNYPTAAIVRRGNDGTGPVLEMNKARGAFGAPTNIQVDDVLGQVTFVGYLTVAHAGAALTVICTGVGGGNLSTAIDFYNVNAANYKQALRIDALSNLCVAGVTAGANATKTIVLPSTGAVAPATSVGAAHLYSAAWNGPGTEFGQTAFAWSQEAAVIAPISAAVVSHLIPVVVNGVAYMLMASTVI